MPAKTGRTGLPGNQTSYKSIKITTAKPGLLQPGANRGSGAVGGKCVDWPKKSGK
jgi:hypothetical protein